MRTNPTSATFSYLRRAVSGDRTAAPVHVMANRELTACMRQVRVAAGMGWDVTLAVLNDTIRLLYPDAAGAPVGDDRRTNPRGRPCLVDYDFIRRLEQGLHSRFDKPRGGWADRSAIAANRFNASRVPPWLVRAYDVAFGADGLLVDIFCWAAAYQADQMMDLPRRTRDLPGLVPAGSEYAFLARDIENPTDVVHALLTEQAGRLVRLREAAPAPDVPWSPRPDDLAGNLGEAEAEAPEGLLGLPGQQIVARYVLHNIGARPWRDRVLYRVGATQDNIGTPPLVPVPDTDPGGTADIRCVMRLPRRPGTYRLCLKMGWPDGTYCFPTTLLGLIVTAIVPPADLTDPYEEWPDHAR